MAIDIREVVYAKDQFEAFDMLRDRPTEDFGLIVEAEPNEDANGFPIRTSALMFRWGRDADAILAIQRAIEEGYPDTTAEDQQFKP